MIDVLVFLFENHFDINTHPAPDTLARKLSAAGFPPDDVRFALEWLNALKLARLANFSANPNALRVYTADEQSHLGEGCIDFIAFLEKTGRITPSQRELILDRTEAFSNDIMSLEKLKIVVLMVLWSQDQRLDPLIIEELLATERSATLH